MSARVHKYFLRLSLKHDMSSDGAIIGNAREYSSPASRLNPGRKNQVIVLAGATAVGKSKVAQLLCRHLGNCEIVVADSVQVYKHLNIGSNKPSIDEQAEIPHHCLDLVDPSMTYSCGDFVREAVPIIYDILNRGNVPVVVGGSTMWIQWLVQGVPDAPKADDVVLAQADALLHDATLTRNWDAAVAVLRTYSPERASKIGPNDWYRCRRYLEVALSTHSRGIVEEGQETDNDATNGASVGCALEGARTPVLPGLDVRCFFMSEDRDELYRTIDSRCEAMLHAGLLQEVTNLVLHEHLLPNTVSAKAIGYRQTLEYLGEYHKLQDARAFQQYLGEFTTATRNYAKRQLHWYRKDKEFLWMRIQRSIEDGIGDMPYQRVVQELCHWKNSSRQAYNQMIRHQLLRAHAVGKMRQWLKRRPKGERLTDYDWLAVAAMVAAGEIRAPQGQAIIGKEEVAWSATFFASQGQDQVDFETLRNVGTPSSEVLDEDEALEQLSLQGSRGSMPRALPEFPNPPLPPSEWTAEDVMVRAAEVNSGSKVQRSPMANKLREYAYNAEDPALRLRALLTVADEAASELRQKYPNILDTFFPDRERPLSRSKSPSSAHVKSCS